MKKLFSLIAVLGLIAGAAYSADLNDGLTREVFAHGKGRSVVSDKSVLLRVWYTGSGNAWVGVSQNSSIQLTEDGALTTADVATYNNIGRMVSYINSLNNWKAEAGPDGYDDYPTRFITYWEVRTAGTSNITPNTSEIYLDSGASHEILCGIPATTNKVNRLKSVTHRLPTSLVEANAKIHVYIYDGNSCVWRESIGAGAYCAAGSTLASPNTVSFGDKGLSAGTGKSLVARVSTDSTRINDGPDKAYGVSIHYDQF